MGVPLGTQDDKKAALVWLEKRSEQYRPLAYAPSNDPKEVYAEGRAEGRQVGTDQERKRIAAVLRDLDSDDLQEYSNLHEYADGSTYTDMDVRSLADAIESGKL